MNLSKELERQKLISRLTQDFKVQDAGKHLLEKMLEARDELEKAQWKEESEDEIELSTSFSNLVVDDVGVLKFCTCRMVS